MRSSACLLTIGYWLWSAFIAVGAGFIGAVLQTDCERESGCIHDPPPPLEPWRWSDYYVYPEVTWIATAGFVAASAALWFVVRHRPVLAAASLLVSLVLLSYPFFGGLTIEGRASLFFGFLLGLGALAVMLYAVVAGRFAPAVTSKALRFVHEYGRDLSQHGELFLPDAHGPHAVVVVIHGGYWRARYDRTLMSGLCEDLARHGVAAWNLEYRRVGYGGGWPETFHDVAAGVDALADLDAPLDLARVGAVGHSAGGQLALWVAARATLPAGAPGAEPRVVPRAVVSQAGVADLRLAAELEPSAEPTRALLGPPSDVYALASPRERLPIGVEQLVLHGERDDVVSMRISESYAAAAAAAGDPCELRVLPGTGHFEHVDASSEAWQIARDWLLEHLR